ncbi:recombinase family protein [Streptomyces sp. NPDC005727]|uniref:recombinase family protein n=1 Tax=Streptomyces sp. NPDC005727 TaxID=3157053 RepID=UPI003407742F
MANLVYKRVSTDQQSTARQNLVLDEAGIETPVVFEEAPGTSSRLHPLQRPQFRELLTYARPGDTVHWRTFATEAEAPRGLPKRSRTRRAVVPLSSCCGSAWAICTLPASGGPRHLPPQARCRRRRRSSLGQELVRTGSAAQVRSEPRSGMIARCCEALRSRPN